MLKYSAEAKPWRRGTKARLWTLMAIVGRRLYARRPAGEPGGRQGEQDLVLERALTLAHNRLLAQVAEESSLDVRTAGIVGFNGALILATIALEEQLGACWWIPLPFLGISTAVLLRSLFGALDRRLAKWTGGKRRVSVGIGPDAARFYDRYEKKGAIAAGEALLGDLTLTYEQNAERFNAKRRRLQAGIACYSLVFWSLPP